ncbi:MAG: hypothetical protein PHH91_03320 [Desulfuromonadaceae bacterium]|nr:hypothetical protein [Desulfuromonadaceae bacterium]
MNTTRCPQCGFKAALLTESDFHTCSQCRALFRVFGGQSVSEQYFRHEPDDALAWGALIGLLDSEGVAVPAAATAISFGYHPFWFAELDNGSTRFKTAGSALNGYPQPSVPPPGNLEFPPPGRSFPQPTIAPETFLAQAEVPVRLRLLQLPLYLINFELPGQQCQATVSGCSWQVYLTKIPNETGIHISSSRLLFLGGYVALLLLAGTLAPNVFWRSSLVALILLVAWRLEISGDREG